jgi:hypothetical protein
MRITDECRNIVATVNLECRLDLKTIALHARECRVQSKGMSTVYSPGSIPYPSIFPFSFPLNASRSCIQDYVAWMVLVSGTEVVWSARREKRETVLLILPLAARLRS